jgi:hypothetical protein
MEGTIFIGIDVSLQNNSVHVMDQSGNKLWQRSFANSLTGSHELVQQLLETRRTRPVSFFNFGLEATGCYGSNTSGEQVIGSVRLPEENLNYSCTGKWGFSLGLDNGSRMS